jgi:hypothetical protein
LIDEGGIASGVIDESSQIAKANDSRSIIIRVIGGL